MMLPRRHPQAVFLRASGKDARVKRVDKILAAKRADPAADVSAWEREIDERVYRLYGLTKEEIKLVEGEK